MAWPWLSAPGWPARLGPVETACGPVVLRPLRGYDGEEWRRMRRRDEALIRPWDVSSTQTWEQRHSAAAWSEHRRMLAGAARIGTSLPFAITVDGMFAGQVTLGGIQRFPLQCGWVGYWVGSELTGNGVATAAVALAVGHALGPGRLHRVDATVALANVPSQRVLQRLGFRYEGLLRRYLDIDGAWRDHQLWALTVEDVPGGSAELVERARRYRAKQL